MSETAGYVLMMALLLILPISALIARRLPLSTTVKYAAAWAAIFVLGYLIVRQFT